MAHKIEQSVHGKALHKLLHFCAIRSFSSPFVEKLIIKSFSLVLKGEIEMAGRSLYSVWNEDCTCSVLNENQTLEDMCTLNVNLMSACLKFD